MSLASVSRSAEHCFQTTAPESWFGWSVGFGAAALVVGVVAFELWMPVRTDGSYEPPSRRQRLLAAIPALFSLALFGVNVIARPRDDAMNMLKWALFWLPAALPALLLVNWKAGLHRAGRPLTARQRVWLRLSRWGATVIAIGAFATALAIFAAYSASSVPVDCSTIP